MKKILAITSIRSDYDLMSPLYDILKNKFNLSLLVCGAHLSKKYGYSVDLIKKDGHKILVELESLIDSDSKKSRIKSASIMLQNSIDIINEYAPNLIMYAGDREDNIVGALIGSYLQIPTAHFYGGDHVQDGHVDNPIRHAVSKLSTYHFVSNELHFKRLIRIGESPERIHKIGAIQLDKIHSHIKKDKSELLKELKIEKDFDDFCLVIFHPLDKEIKQTSKIFRNILSSLEQNKIKAFVNFPNSDPSNHDIIEIIEKNKNNDNFYFFKNLPRDLFLSIYKNSIFQIGNSSSGILESASIPIPVINVGNRQIGRAQSGNVIFCKTQMKDISNAISLVTTSKFQNSMDGIKNIYGDGKSANRAMQVLQKLNFENKLYKTEDPLDISI